MSEQDFERQAASDQTSRYLRRVEQLTALGMTAHDAADYAHMYEVSLESGATLLEGERARLAGIEARYKDKGLPPDFGIFKTEAPEA